MGADIAIPGDYTGDGKTDLAARRDGTVYVSPSGGGSTIITKRGVAGDFPVANIFTE